MKIDTSKINGYEQMSAEEKLKALEAYDMEFDTSGYVKKDMFDKSASELSALKKQLKEKMSEEEQAKAKADEELQNMKAELEELKREKAIQNNTNQFLALGYEKELAEKTAKALYEGDMQVVFANQKTFQENLLKKERADILKDTPRPETGNSTKTVTREDFKKMTYLEKVELFNENQDLYNTLSKGD